MSALVERSLIAINDREAALLDTERLSEIAAA
jgi:hypothetical protein